MWEVEERRPRGGGVTGGESEEEESEEEEGEAEEGGEEEEEEGTLGGVSERRLRGGTGEARPAGGDARPARCTFSFCASEETGVRAMHALCALHSARSFTPCVCGRLPLLLRSLASPASQSSPRPLRGGLGTWRRALAPCRRARCAPCGAERGESWRRLWRRCGGRSCRGSDSWGWGTPGLCLLRRGGRGRRAWTG